MSFDTFMAVAILLLSAAFILCVIALAVLELLDSYLRRDRAEHSEGLRTAPVDAERHSDWPFEPPYSPVPWRIWDMAHSDWKDWGME